MATPMLAAAHLQGHLLNHKGTERSKVEAIKRPTVSAAGTSQDWLYFLSRLEDYVKATNVKGEDQAIQLLECCDPDLRKAIQRNNGGVALSQPNSDTDDEKCYFCGKTGHGKYPQISLRSAECPAFGHTCGKCGKKNHADRVCRSKQP